MHTVHDRFMRNDNFARLAHGSVVDVGAAKRNQNFAVYLRWPRISATLEIIRTAASGLAS
jgi:hypothetical protein